MHKILYSIFSAIHMVSICIPLLPYAIVYKLLSQNARSKYLSVITRYWGKGLLWASRTKLTVEGRENLPKHNNICFVSNHQSSLDIPIVLAAMKRLIGFVAKKELLKIPFLNFWMIAIDCVFINRKRGDQALRQIKDRATRINNGHALVIFPEGTRSSNQEMQEFKTAGLRMILSEDVTVVPISIIGSYKIMGKEKKPTRVTLKIHEAIDITNMTRVQRKKELLPMLEEKINPLNYI